MQADYLTNIATSLFPLSKKEKNTLFGYMQGSIKTSMIRRMHECVTKSFKSDGTYSE